MTSAKVDALVRDQIRYVESLLYNGSAMGGQSLVGLLHEYSELDNAAYHPLRYDLLHHLRRCVSQIEVMQSYIVARARMGKSPPPAIRAKKSATKKRATKK